MRFSACLCLLVCSAFGVLLLLLVRVVAAYAFDLCFDERSSCVSLFVLEFRGRNAACASVLASVL